MHEDDTFVPQTAALSTETYPFLHAEWRFKIRVHSEPWNDLRGALGIVHRALAAH